MKIENAGITFLVGSDCTRIELYDKVANVQFVKIELTPEQLSMALSRQAYTPCKTEVMNTDVLGKEVEIESLVFEIPYEIASSTHSDKLHAIATELLKDGWVADSYFGSQNTFTQSGGKSYARCTIRRWNDKKQAQ